MPIPEQYTEVFYGFQVTGDNELMGITMAWATGAGVPPEEDVLGHYNRFVALVRPRYSNLMAFPLVRTATGTGSGDYTQEIAPDPVLLGTGSLNLLPNNCAILVAKITTSGGRRNRGRFYLPCPNEGNTDQTGRLTTGERGAWQTIVDDWIDGEQTIGWGTPALLHQTGPSAPTTVTNLVVRQQIGTQRRRMRP